MTIPSSMALWRGRSHVEASITAGSMMAYLTESGAEASSRKREKEDDMAILNAAKKPGPR